jgi:hypothetical protein
MSTHFNPGIGCGLVVAALLLSVDTQAQLLPPSQPQQVVSLGLPPGTVLLSRNRCERENTSPGHWNHTAIVVNATEIVETQAEPVERGQVGVIRTQLSDYLARDYEPIMAYQPRDLAAGQRAAMRAENLVGLPNRNASSIFRRFPAWRQEKGLSCVTSAVEIPWGPENRAVRGIVVPDGMQRPRVNRSFLPPVRIR